MPGGRLMADQVSGATAPLPTEKPTLHGCPNGQSSAKLPYGLMFGRVGGTPITEIDISLLYETWLVSVAVTVNAYLPTPAVTVPEITPLSASVNPAGSATAPGTQLVPTVLPGHAANVYPPEPPVAVSVAL